MIEAVQFEGDNGYGIIDWINNEGGKAICEHVSCGDYWAVYIETLEGSMAAGKGDWIIRGVKGEFYPCKPDIFEATYDPIVSAWDVDTPDSNRPAEHHAG